MIINNFDLSLIIFLSITSLISGPHILSAKDLFSSIIVYGIFSLNIVLLYIAMRALDVGITEVTVGSAMSTIFALLVISAVGKKLTQTENTTSNIYRKILQFSFAIVCLLFFIALCHCMLMISPFGQDSHSLTAGNYYITHSINEFGVANIVTSILGGYRGFDTLLETTVILTAAFGVSAILKKDMK